MATKIKKRINISVSGEIDQSLSKLAKRDQMPVATKALELIKKALQLEEDVVLDLLAEKRDTADAGYLSHQKAWSRSMR